MNMSIQRRVLVARGLMLAAAILVVVAESINPGIVPPKITNAIRR
jgi:hypothetical protein